MRPLSKPLTVVIILSLSLAFGFWLTRQISSWSAGFFSLKYFILMLVFGAAIAFAALWYRGALGQVHGLLQNPIAAAITKTFAVTAGLVIVGLVGYMFVTTDADEYKDFILNRNFALWAIILPMIATALLTIYSVVGIPPAYRAAIPRGLWQLTGAAFVLIAAFIYFYPDHHFSKTVKSEIGYFAGQLTGQLASAKDEVVKLGSGMRDVTGKVEKLGKSPAIEPKKPAEPKVYVYVESPKADWLPYPGYHDDQRWYAWAASSLEAREECRVSSDCQRAMRRLKEFGCLAPDNGLLTRCTGR